jgi:hypothetical protein
LLFSTKRSFCGKPELQFRGFYEKNPFTLPGKKESTMQKDAKRSKQREEA